MSSITSVNFNRFNRKANITIILLALVMSSCSSGFSRYNDVYLRGMRSEIEYMGGTYVISDRFDIGGLYIRGDFGTSFDAGTASGTATNGEEDNKNNIKAAAIKYLTNQGRGNCVLDKGTEVMTGQYEFKYKCGKK